MISWLIDKSALVRLPLAQDAEGWSERVERGLIRISTPTLLEVGMSAINEHDWEILTKGFPVNMSLICISDKAERRALEMQHLMATRGQHRAPSVADLLIAAVAELEGLTLLNVDKDFELIAEFTKQPVERLILA